MLLQIKESQIEPDITLVGLTGRLALGRESQQLEGMVTGFLTQGRRLVIFDLSAVDYIDSAGIGMLALVAGQLKEHGGRLILVAVEGRVRSLVRQTQLDAIMPMCGSVTEATGLLSGGHSSALS
jgi:anti-sigma B factor antagonist